ncbi:hypothetical protein [Flavobacterium sp. I-STPA6A]|uniref:hypothetical protein n=1 Tax=Flavobacterium sp. I-STPA6A TaxID=2590450 RepID=UPI00131B2657|nr:hypothetical protein [Flavobacterium sp. I-STPA6A]
MAKKDISKILTTGSLKQRILLVAEQRARFTYGKEPILTDHEFNQLSDSFKKPNEIKLWNEWNKHAVKITGALSNLQGLMFEVQVNYSNLRGYILVWNSIENAELLVNSVLHEIKDPKERKRIAESGAKGVDLLFSKTATDQEGYIDIEIDFEKQTYKGKKYNEEPDVTKEYSLLYIMNNVKAEAITSAIRFLSWRQAILDYIEETGFNVKTYKEILQGFTDRVCAPIIGWEKYSGEINTGLPHPQVEKILKKYAITPKIEELEVDEVVYNTFKIDFLGDE